MKRRVCSYDMFAVPDPSFLLGQTQQYCHQGQSGSVFLDCFASFTFGCPKIWRSGERSTQNSRVCDDLTFNRPGQT